MTTQSGRKDAPAPPAIENTAPLVHKTHQKRISVVRMETVEAREKRLAEGREKERARKTEEGGEAEDAPAPPTIQNIAPPVRRTHQGGGSVLRIETVGAKERTSPTLTPGIQSGMSSPRPSAPPHSTHPGPHPPTDISPPRRSGDHLSSESSTTGIKPVATVPLSTIFCADDADMVIRAGGALDFHAHKLILSLTSPLFKDMSSISQPPPDTPPHVDVQESAKTWENILRIIYPLPNPIIDDLDDLESLLLAAKKYEIQIIIDSYKKCFENHRFIQQDPLHLYAIACACGFDDEAKYVARHAEHLTVVRSSDAGDLKGLTVESYIHLISFLTERDNMWYQILSTDLTLFGIHCPCDEGHKEVFYGEIKENLKLWHLQMEEIYDKALEDPRRLQSQCGTVQNCVFTASKIMVFIKGRMEEREAVCDKFIWRRKKLVRTVNETWLPVIRKFSH